MNKQLIVLIILLLSIIGLIECKLPNRNFKRMPKGDLNLIDKDLNLDAIQYQYFKQNQDHFDLANKNTFQQRYLVNNQYWNGTGPVFVMINGEAGIDATSVTYYIYVSWAKQVGALIVSLEHRYYGASFVTPDLSVANLKYLTVDQALEDNAVFLTWFLENSKVPSTSSIVSFGGSYAGVLTSFMKIKYPQLIDFTISSSGPVGIVLDFEQYLQVTQTTILSVEGGEQCLENIAAAHAKVEAMVKQVNNGGVYESFNLCAPLKGENDIVSFLYAVMGNWMSAGQFNEELPSLPSIQQMCNVMNNNTQDALANYMTIWEQSMTPGECMEVSYKSEIDQYLSTANNAATEGGRIWQWQLCTQFGFFITSDAPPSQQPFGSELTYKFQQQQCQAIFGIPNMSPNVSSIIDEFGGFKPNLEAVQDILYVTGTNDPWSAIGISKFTNPLVNNTLSILDGSHCGDMMPVTLVSPPALGPAHTEILQFILNRLNYNN